MKHFVKCNVGINKGLIYTVPSKKRANELIKTIERRFGKGPIYKGTYVAEYGNERDGFVEQQLKAGARFMSENQDCKQCKRPISLILSPLENFKIQSARIFNGFCGAFCEKQYNEEVRS